MLSGITSRNVQKRGCKGPEKIVEPHASMEQIQMKKMGNYAAIRIKVDRFFDQSYFLALLLRYSPICCVSLAKVS
jgi:hypothetical protein